MCVIGQDTLYKHMAVHAMCTRWKPRCTQYANTRKEHKDEIGQQHLMCPNAYTGNQSVCPCPTHTFIYSVCVCVFTGALMTAILIQVF